MDSTFAFSAGEALVASVGEMAQSSTNKLRDISRKVTLVRLLDDTTSNTNNQNPDDKDKENGTRTINTADHKIVLSERSSSNNSSRNTSRTTVVRANHGTVEALRDLRDLSSIVSEIERRAATLRNAIDTHRRDNEARREMSETTLQQTAQLAATLLALPEHLPHAAPQPATASAPSAAVGAQRTAPAADSGLATCSRGNMASTAAGAEVGLVATSDLPEVPVLELVTVGELEGVPRSTRARLTIEQVNAAVAEIQRTIERRHAFLSKPRKKMSEKQRNRLEELLQQQVPAHGGEPFISEPDLRALPAFKKGEMTAKALIATLRNLKRLKGVRGAGMMTYIVQGA
eukprot:g9795.t1